MDGAEIEAYRKAGKIAKQVSDYAKEFVKPGMLLVDIAEKIDAEIIGLGGEMGFPVNLSINEIAAHYTPCLEDKTKAEGLLKIDFGVCVDGYIADTAFSLDLTEDKRFGEMIKLNQEILNSALAVVKQGMRIKEIGGAVQNKLKASGKDYVVIKNLSGHSLDKDEVHSGLTISNYENKNETELKDVAIAIEPFLTTGAGEIYEGKESEIFMLQSDKQVRDKDARELLKFIKENYKTRPFCKRWLEKENINKLNFILRMLVNQGVLHNFPILIEKTKKPVSQAEHTVLIKEDVEVTTR